MKSLFTLLVLVLLAGNCYAATITSAGSGAWSAGETWTGGVVPNPGSDTAVITGGHTVTITDSRTIPQTTIGTNGTYAVLVIGTGATVQLAGELSGYDHAELKHQAGSTLNTAGYDIKSNQAAAGFFSWTIEGTANSRAVISSSVTGSQLTTTPWCPLKKERCPYPFAAEKCKEAV